ncbi:MAG TPA: hypothetical protein VHO70_22860 [Chitinispirillaceae bacterium]|nr:hypothetical protein [Chitinispirillaceae bacterium]
MQEMNGMWMFRAGRAREPDHIAGVTGWICLFHVVQAENNVVQGLIDGDVLIP